MKLKLVVIENNILGIIHPGQPNQAAVIAASPLRGASHGWKDGPYPISPMTPLRLASKDDFDAFRVCFNGYSNPEEYEFAIPASITMSNPGMKLMILDGSKLYEVVAICPTVDEANKVCETNPKAGVICNDEQGRIYIANE